MSFYKIAITGKHHLSLQEKASVEKKASGLDCVGKIKVSRERPATREKPFLSEKETKFPNTLLLFKNAQSLGRYLNSTSRFLRDEIVDVYSDTLGATAEDPSLAPPVTLMTPLSATQIQTLKEAGIEVAEAAEFNVEKKVDLDSSKGVQTVGEGDLEEVTAEECAEDIDGQKLSEALGVAALFKMPQKSILKPPSSQASVSIIPQVLYLTPPGTVESCFDALLSFFQTRGQTLSDMQIDRLKIQFVQFAMNHPLNKAVKEILLRNSAALGLSEVAKTSTSVELVTGIDINKESLIKAEIEMEREQWEEEQAQPLTQKEQYNENVFFARLLLAPEKDWLENQAFVDYVKMLSFEMNVDFMYQVDRRISLMLSHATENDDMLSTEESPDDFKKNHQFKLDTHLVM